MRTSGGGAGRRSWPAAVVALLVLVGCSDDGEGDGDGDDGGSASSAPADETTDATTDVTTDVTSTSPVTVVDDTASDGFFDEASVHDVSISFDQSDYDALIAAYREDGDKTWIEADVTIDGIEYANSGMRLKGNSSLFGLGGGPGGPGGPGGGPDVIDGQCVITVDQAGAPNGPVPAGEPDGPVMFGPGSADPDAPATLPWLIRLDKYVEDQHHEGVTQFVVRSNPTTTSLNEATALDLLEQAGLASQRASAVRMTVNDSEPTLRLVIENPDDRWADSTFGDGTLLYKADASGDYTYRGDDPEAYAEAWDQDAGADDLTPLIDFLDLVNNTSDAEFAAALEEVFDVDAFARYLAIEELMSNFDDIDGPGNNSYLAYDPEADRFTVVAWDHNLALTGRNEAGDPGGVAPFPGDVVPASLPEGCEPPEGGGPIIEGNGGPSDGRENPLVRRFLDTPAFAEKYAEAKADLRALFSDGTAGSILDRWAALLTADAADVVDARTVTDEADAVRAAFP